MAAATSTSRSPSTHDRLDAADRGAARAGRRGRRARSSTRAATAPSTSSILAGNRVELWTFFRDGDGARDGVMALAEDGDGK